MTVYLIALGGNLLGEIGDVASTLTVALERLTGNGEVAVNALSDWYQTPAWPPGSGPDFVNGAARIASDLDPEAVLKRLHEVEEQLGRVRPERWAPRICDLDLLGSGDLVAPNRETVRNWMSLSQETAQRTAPDELVLPHPRLHERAFVLVPLAQIAPDWMHPILGKTTVQMLAKLPNEDIAAIKPM
jgi:2-amino-4-hydroxy-6-hydroxymethyldihydropteridine diphosphokinase